MRWDVPSGVLTVEVTVEGLAGSPRNHGSHRSEWSFCICPDGEISHLKGENKIKKHDTLWEEKGILT